MSSDDSNSEDLLGDDKNALKRSPWRDMPPIVIHAAQSSVKQHPLYARAKAGDAAAAEALVLDCIDVQASERISGMCLERTYLLAVHALETEGMNAIPRVFARILSKMLDLPLASGIIQSNTVSHTGATGYHRLAFPALFEGDVPRENYFLVDDFVGQGGTIANLKGFVEHSGGTIIGATALTGRADSAFISLEEATIMALRSKHGAQLEEWWTNTFGYDLARLTESEARYLERVDSFDAIRERLASARRARD